MQALQHPWIVSAGSGTDLEECYLSWDEADDSDYNLMSGAPLQDSLLLGYRNPPLPSLPFRVRRQKDDPWAVPSVPDLRSLLRDFTPYISWV